MRAERTGKTALVTGGTDGIGREVACGLARAGHSVIIVGRDAAKGSRSVRWIRESTGNSFVQFFQADLSLMSEAIRLADEVILRWPALNYLVHSAGVVRGRRKLTSEGVESNFAINFLSRFVLTKCLLPLLESAGRPGHAARIVINGGAAQNGTIYFDDVNLMSRFGMLRAVGQFCQANDVFTIELARRLTEGGCGASVTINCLKIGVVKTNIRREFPWWMKILVPVIFDPLLGQTPQEAAGSTLRLLLDEEFENVSGGLFLKIRKFKRISPSVRAAAADTGSRLWDLGERFLAGLHGSANSNLSLVPIEQ